MKLQPGETLVCAYPEYCKGAGWSNTIVWLIIQDNQGKLRQESLQPEEQSREVCLLFPVALSSYNLFKREVLQQLTTYPEAKEQQ